MGTGRYRQESAQRCGGDCRKTAPAKSRSKISVRAYDKNGKKLDLPPFKGGYLEGHYRVTFCGFFPYENPKYTCIVLISDPKVPYRGPRSKLGHCTQEPRAEAQCARLACR